MYCTRIAPSPTGFAHVGLARTAYFNWLAARASNGKFILRIDDTDRKRNDPQYVKVIFDVMDWLKLDFDLTFNQSDRFDIYHKIANNLIDLGFATKQDDSVVLSIPQGFDYPSEWLDNIVGKIKITEDDRKNADGTVLIKSDGSPSYNFASVIDDIEYNINFIIRGVDHITNTSKQAILFKLLNATLPEFAHVGLICSQNKPMSKRDGASSMINYINRGYDPDGILNFLARLGWSPTKDDKTTAVLPRDKMLQMFLTEGKMKASNANFDAVKLDSFDRKYKVRKNEGKL